MSQPLGYVVIRHRGGKPIFAFPTLETREWCEKRIELIDLRNDQPGTTYTVEPVGGHTGEPGEVERLKERIEQLVLAIRCAKNEIDRESDGSDDGREDVAIGVLIDALPAHDWQHDEVRATEARHVYCRECYDSLTWRSIDGGPPILLSHPSDEIALKGWVIVDEDEAFCPLHAAP